MQKLVSKGIQVKENDLQSFNDVAIKDHLDKVEVAKKLYDVLADACILYYGLHPSQLQDIVLTKAIKDILLKYNYLKLSEIAYSFERLELERKVTVILDDLIAPIKKYSIIKLSVVNESKLLNASMTQEQETKYKEQEFQKQSIEFYNQCLQKKQWTGTIFQANALKELLKVNFDIKIREKMWIEAGDEVIKVDESDYDLWYANFGRNQERIYSEKLVKLAIEKGVKI